MEIFIRGSSAIPRAEPANEEHRPTDAGRKTRERKKRERKILGFPSKSFCLQREKVTWMSDEGSQTKKAGVPSKAAVGKIIPPLLLFTFAPNIITILLDICAREVVEVVKKKCHSPLVVSAFSFPAFPVIGSPFSSNPFNFQ